MTLDRTGALRALVDKAAVDLEGHEHDAEAILRWAVEHLGGQVIVATSMQDAVVVDLAARVLPGIDVVFLDTGYHFAETIGLRDAVAATYDVRLLSVRPGQSVAEQDRSMGPDLFASNPELCCHLRKVVPLDTMLNRYDGWVTGLRRVEASTRVGVMPVEWDGKREMLKINPIVTWSDSDVEAYIVEHGVLVNPLRSEGFPSIGCAPCTARVAPGADPRSGRWAGVAKEECGLHEI
jgi:phosphoadenosine phosphosulfate reductase